MLIYLSESDRKILEKDNSELSAQQRINLYWSIDALWALAWVSSLIDELTFDKPVQSSLASLCPKLHQNEDGSKFVQRMRLRPLSDLFRMRDLYYRLHWWTREAHLQGQDTGDVCIDIIMERRKALEWVMNANYDWDSVKLIT